jgi:SPP1 family predicted phage head-tail adaptor
MNVNPGELNKKIEIYTQSTDVFHAVTETLYCSCAAKFSRTSGAEVIKSGANLADINVRFLIRYPVTKTIDRTMIVKYSGAKYQIEYVNDYEDKHEYVEIFARLVG